MLDRETLYDARLVARLARGPVAGPPSLHPQRGVHTSHRRGASLEFSEHTEYSPGDDLKHLDWKVYAKSDRYFVRRYEDERLSRAILVVDGSGSMGYGGDREELAGSKFHLAAQVAVALSACMLRQGDAVGLAVAADLSFELPPRAGMAQLDAIIELLGRVQPTGEARLSETCRAAGERLGRSAALWVVSDFLDEEVEPLTVFGLLKARAVAPRLVQVLHHDEVDLPFEQTTRFKALEGAAELVMDPDAVREAYFEEMRAYIEGLARRAGGMGVPYALVRDAEEAGDSLAPLVRARRAGNGVAGGNR